MTSTTRFNGSKSLCGRAKEKTAKRKQTKIYIELAPVDQSVGRSVTLQAITSDTKDNNNNNNSNKQRQCTTNKDENNNSSGRSGNDRVVKVHELALACLKMDRCAVASGNHTHTHTNTLHQFYTHTRTYAQKLAGNARHTACLQDKKPADG